MEPTTATDVARPSEHLGQILPALAFLLDGIIKRGGELQIRREQIAGTIGTVWTVTVWEPDPSPRAIYMRRRLSLRARTSYDLLRSLQEDLSKQEKT